MSVRRSLATVNQAQPEFYNGNIVNMDDSAFTVQLDCVPQGDVIRIPLSLKRFISFRVEVDVGFIIPTSLPEDTRTYTLASDVENSILALCWSH